MFGPELKGEKIILKPVRLSEAKKFLAWIKDPQVNKFISSSSDFTLEQERDYLNKAKIDKNKIMWSIFTKDGKLIGNTDLHNLSIAHCRTSWGIIIGEKEEWNKGYGADTLKTVMNFAFNKLKLNRFELEVFHKNIAGIKCYKKCGFKREGTRRDYFHKNGKIYNSIVMSVLKKDFESKK